MQHQHRVPPPTPHCQRRYHPPPSPHPRCHATPPSPHTTDPPSPLARCQAAADTSSHHLHCYSTAATTASATATAVAFPAVAVAVAGCGWQFGHHRRDGAYTTSDLGLSAPKPPLWWRSDDGTATTAAPCGVKLVV
nr:hypothetical protein [Tanacetum cinerariifolium]